MVMKHPFEPYLPECILGRVLCCLIILVFNILYEALNVTRIRRFNKEIEALNNNNQYSENTKLVESKLSIKSQMFNSEHVTQSVLHLLQVVLRFLLLTSFMTLHWEYCVSVLAGGGMAYFVFAWRSSNL